MSNSDTLHDLFDEQYYTGKSLHQRIRDKKIEICEYKKQKPQIEMSLDELKELVKLNEDLIDLFNLEKPVINVLNNMQP